MRELLCCCCVVLGSADAGSVRRAAEFEAVSKLLLQGFQHLHFSHITATAPRQPRTDHTARRRATERSQNKLQKPASTHPSIKKRKPFQIRRAGVCLLGEVWRPQAAANSALLLLSWAVLALLPAHTHTQQTLQMLLLLLLSAPKKKPN